MIPNAPPSLYIRAVDLVATWFGLPEQIRNDTQIASLVLKHFLGLDWLNKHVDPDATKRGPLTLSGTATEIEHAKIRVVDLGEALFNLQHVEGFFECVGRLKTADVIEPAIAELHIGKMIYVNDWAFKFIEPSPGHTYDYLIDYGSLKVAADAKCKIQSLIPDAKSITRTLSGSRKQLPADGPGIFFMKLPQQWMDHPGWQKITVTGAQDFFAQGTGRVCSVVFYLEPIKLLDFRAEKGQHYIAEQGHYFYEIANPRRRYGNDLDWRLFDKWRPTDHASWSALPRKYLRLFEFPNGIRQYDEHPANVS
jgi:hypothetical protein